MTGELWYKLILKFIDSHVTTIQWLSHFQCLTLSHLASVNYLGVLVDDIICDININSLASD